MHFAFTEDQSAINDAARTMLVESCTPADLRRLLDSGAARDEARWNTICEMGLLGMLAPVDRGGMGLAMIDFVAIAEAAGYVALPEPLVELAGVAVPLLASLDDPGDLLGAAIGGGVVALGHPANPLVADADEAIAFVLGHGEELHLVDAIDVRRTRRESFDPFRHLSAVVWTPARQTLAGTSWGLTFQRGALLAAAQLIGVAQRSVDMAVAYAKERTQFGKPIGSYQAVKHLAADAQVRIEFARPVVEAAAFELHLDTPASRARVAHAKIAAGTAADLATRNAVQIHGAMGMTWEVDLHFWVKRALALRQAWGTPANHAATIAGRLKTHPAGSEFTFASAMPV